MGSVGKAGRAESVVDRKRDHHLQLFNAWRMRNLADFQNWLTDDVDTTVLEALLLNIISDFTQAGKKFAQAFFEKDAHREIFATGKSLIRRIVELGNWPILELVLSFYPNLREATDEGNTSLHYLCQIQWHENSELFRKCMTALLDQSEIDVNALNNCSYTPIDIALDFNNRDAIEVLLRKAHGLYLDGRLPDRLTARQRLLKNYKDLAELLPPEEAENKITGSTLSLMLKKNYENTFCSYFQIAMQDDSLKRILSTKKHIYLQEACARHMVNAIKMLMDYGADPSYIDQWNDFRSSIIIAVEKGYLEILPLLLERASVPKYKNSHSGRSIDANQTIENGNTALHYAVLYGNETAIMEILKFGGYMCAENLNHEIPLTNIPEHVLRQFLDRNIKPAQLGATNRDQVLFKYGFLARPCKNRKTDIESQNSSNPPEMKILREMSKIEELRPLLLHPLLASFILLKWQRLKIIFMINLFFYTLLSLFLTFNILWVSMTGDNILVATIFQGLLVGILLLREVFQAAIINPRRYIYQFENYIEVGLIILSCFLTISNFYHTALIGHFGAGAVLLSWFGFLLLIGKHPLFSVQVEMFLLVLSSFIRFLSVYVIMIIAFALAFFILFNEYGDTCSVNAFADFGTSVFKTLIMVSGEFDASDIPFPIYPGTSHIIFILFVFLVAIVLVNLLNGLAVYDTQMIKTDALLHSYVSRVKYLASLEELLFGLQKWPCCGRVRYFLEFDSEFNTAESKKKQNSFQIDADILQAARERVKANELAKRAVELEQERLKLFSDSAKRSEILDETNTVVKEVLEKFGDVIKRLNSIENSILKEKY